MQLFDDSEYEVWHCPNCNAEFEDDYASRDCGEMCVECWVNEDCPAGCAGEHDEPEPDYDGQWTCPETGETFVRDAGSWDTVGRYNSTSTYVDLDDEWYCEPYEYGFAYCEDCGEWRYQDDMRYDRYGDERGCSYCSRYNDYGFMPSPDPTTCDHCGQHAVLTHWNPVTEEVSCATCAKGEPIPVIQAA